MVATEQELFSVIAQRIDPDEGQGTLLGSDKGGQGTQMTRLENRKCPERDGKVVWSWGGVSKRKSQMGE